VTSNREQIFDEVREVLCRTFGLAEDSIALDKRLVEDLEFDSIDAIDLSVQLEGKLGFAPKGQELRTLVTVGDVVEFIFARQGASPERDEAAAST